MSDETKQAKAKSTTTATPSAPADPELSKAAQARLEQYRRTGRPPAGYAFNVAWPEKLRRIESAT